MRKPRVLIVEDNDPWKNTIVRLLRDENICLEHVNTLEAAKILLSQRRCFDIVITNMVLEEGSPLLGGLEVLDKVRGRRSATQCIVLTEDRDFLTAVRILNDYREIVYAIIPKTNPWLDHTEFLEKFRGALAIVSTENSAQRRLHADHSSLSNEARSQCVTRIKEHLQNDELQQAIALLPDIGIRQKIVCQLNRRWNSLREKERKGTINDQDANVERAKIADEILKLITE